MSLLTHPAFESRTSSARADAAVLDHLREQLDDSRRSQVNLRRGLLSVLSLTGGSLSLLWGAVLDFWLELPFLFRAGWLVISTGGMVATAVILWRRWVHHYSLSAAAAQAESRLTDFGQRLRTTVDYDQLSTSTFQPTSTAQASPYLLQALRRQTLQLSSRLPWDDVLDYRPLFWSLTGGLTLLMVWLGALLVAPEFRIASARTVLLPWDYTTVTYSPAMTTVRSGDAVEIVAHVQGRPIREAHVSFRPLGSAGTWMELPLKPQEASQREQASAKHAGPATSTTEHPMLTGKLTASLTNLESDLEFRVVAGPRELAPGQIRVLQPLKIESVRARIIPPEYLARQPEIVEGLDLTVPEGSSIELSLTLNRPAQTAALRAVSSTDQHTSTDAEAVPAATEPVIKDTEIQLTMSDIRQPGQWIVAAKSGDGIDLPETSLSIRVQLDQPPHIQILEPHEELVVTPTTEVRFAVEAADDLHLGKVGIAWQLGDGALQTLIEQNAEGTTENYTLESLLQLEELQLQYPDALTWYAFAEDNYFGQPRRVTTPLRFIDIRPYKLEFQAVDSNCSCNGSSVTLEELITRQRQNLSQTFRQGARPASDAAVRQDLIHQDLILQELTQYQTEIRDATDEFATGMAALGMSIKPLEQAIARMEQSINDLQSSAIPDAIQSEQQALAALISARQNIRQILKQSSSASASQCRKFDRQQRQKLKLPEKKRDPAPEGLAQAREKAEDLARREREWSQQVKQSASTPAASPSRSSQQPNSSNPSASTSPQSAETPMSATPQQNAAETTPQEQRPTESENQESTRSEPKNEDDGQQPARPTPSELAERQAALQRELAELQQLLEQSSPPAANQARQAGESMQQGEQASRSENPTAAAEAGERSAEQLEQLADHLAAMATQDFGERLERAQQTAAELADRQARLARKLTPSDPAADDGERPVSGSAKDPNGSSSTPSSGASGGPSGEPSQEGDRQSTEPQAGTDLSDSDLEDLAAEQAAVATRAAMLAELLKRLSETSAAENSDIHSQLQQVQATHNPDEIAQTLQSAARQLAQSDVEQAGSHVNQGRNRLAELARSLGVARASYAQPQLQELMDLEAQLAQLIDQRRRDANQNGGRSSTDFPRRNELEERLQRLAQGDSRVAAALQRLNEASSATSSAAGSPMGEPRGNGGNPQAFEAGGSPPAEGFYPGLSGADHHGLNRISQVLQAKIQEAILAGALLDLDQPVPPAYKQLVDEYYRALSDDLK